MYLFISINTPFHSHHLRPYRYYRENSKQQNNINSYNRIFILLAQTACKKRKKNKNRRDWHLGLGMW